MQDFNLETAETELTKTKNWSEHAVMTIEKILTENETVSFAAEFKINDHYFGSVEVFAYCGRSIDLRSVILSLNCGCLAKNLQEFSKGSNSYYIFGPIYIIFVFIN